MENLQPQLPTSARSDTGKLHLTVGGFVGVAIAFLVTYPIAMWRVSQMEKFKGFHVIGLDQYYQPIPKSLTSEALTP